VAVLVAALRSLSITPSDLAGIEADLQGDLAALPMRRLGLDSLGSMEFCIHLELDHDVVITPADLLRMQTVQELIAHLRPQDP
jgi:acyl carrier protein